MSSELEDELRRVADACRQRAEELEDELAADERWRQLGTWIVDLIKQHGPQVVQALLGIAVQKGLERLGAED